MRVIGHYLFHSLRYLSLGLLIASCSWKPVQQFQLKEMAIEQSGGHSGKTACGDIKNYIPWAGQNGMTPIRVIRLNYHFMNSADSTKNLRGEGARKFAEDLITLANEEIANNQQMRLPLGNNTPVLHPLIEYEIVKDKNGKLAIYEHFDDDYYYLVKKGPERNNYNRSVIDRYGVGLDSILNVFVQAPPPVPMRGNNYGGLKTGVALRNGVRISGPLLTDRRMYTYSGLFNHEVGHILGLRHSWMRDQCDDTPDHPNCWNFTRDGSVCDSLVSNNIMDSNADLDAWTPCQIGIMQRSLTEEQRFPRRFIRQDFCERQSHLDIRISDSVEWCMEKDIVSDIIIEKGGKLILSNRISMAKATGIYIEKGGQLILRKEGRLHNACNYLWDGIYARARNGISVMVEEGGRVEDTSQSPFWDAP